MQYKRKDRHDNNEPASNPVYQQKSKAIGNENNKVQQQTQYRPKTAQISKAESDGQQFRYQPKSSQDRKEESESQNKYVSYAQPSDKQQPQYRPKTAQQEKPQVQQSQAPPKYQRKDQKKSDQKPAMAKDHQSNEKQQYRKKEEMKSKNQDDYRDESQQYYDEQPRYGGVPSGQEVRGSQNERVGDRYSRKGQRHAGYNEEPYDYQRQDIYYNQREYYNQPPRQQPMSVHSNRFEPNPKYQPKGTSSKQRHGQDRDREDHASGNYHNRNYQERYADDRYYYDDQQRSRIIIDNLPDHSRIFTDKESNQQYRVKGKGEMDEMQGAQRQDYYRHGDYDPRMEYGNEYDFGYGERFDNYDNIDVYDYGMEYGRGYRDGGYRDEGQRDGRYYDNDEDFYPQMDDHRNLRDNRKDRGSKYDRNQRDRGDRYDKSERDRGDRYDKGERDRGDKGGRQGKNKRDREEGGNQKRGDTTYGRKDRRPPIEDDTPDHHPFDFKDGEYREDQQNREDTDEEEFKWDDEEEFKEDDNPDDIAYSHGGSSTASGSTTQGGNNQISRRYYAMGQQTDHVKSPCTVVMVAEKPSIAQSITEALCGKNFSKKTGPAKGIPIYTFKGHFKGYAANFKVTSVAGHVYNRDFPLQFQDRRRDPVILFEAPTIRNCDRRAKPVAKHLQVVSNNCDFMVLWLDCDKEGENICFEVLDICKRNIPKSSHRIQRVYRAKFSSIANKDIVSAFEGLKHEPNYNESISVDARQVLDLKIGVAFSRFQTNALVQSIRRAGVRMLTYGPCQTPTLGFCVDQAEKIKKFIPETYWRVIAEIVDENTGKTHSMKWCRGKIFDKVVCTVIHQRLQMNYGAKEAEVLSVKKTKMTQQRPQGLNTVKLLKVGSQSYGLSAYETMKIAESLYLRGYTTYPRTESTTFSNNFNFKEVLNSLKDHEEFGDYAASLLKNGFNKPRKGVDAGDHPPITPVRAASPGSLGGAQLKIYEYITQNFLGCISRDASYDGIRTELLIGEEKFKLKGQILTDPGFLEIMPWLRHGDKEIPVFQIGDIIDIKSTKVAEGKTEAPGFLTEADLISQMEKHGIGTDASIPTHIANIIERNYVVVKEPGRQLIPTMLGHALVKGYCEIDPELVLPQVRSNIEKSCELIAKGKADFNKVVNHVLKIFKDKFMYFKLSLGTMERILNVMLNTSSAQDKALCLSSKIRLREDSKDTMINFCIKCFKGHLCLQYHNRKGWGLKCDSCQFRVSVCTGAARVLKVKDEEMKCGECNSFAIDVVYKENSPFPAGKTSHQGCILCDSWLRGTIHTFYSKQQTKLMTPAEIEAANKLKEERKKQKEEQKKLKELEKGPANNAPKDGEKKKPKKKKQGNAPDLLTEEERMNEFMKKFNKPKG